MTVAASVPSMMKSWQPEGGRVAQIGPRRLGGGVARHERGDAARAAMHLVTAARAAFVAEHPCLHIG